MKRLLVSIVLLSSLALPIYAKGTDTLSIGGSGGCSNFNVFSGEIYLKSTLDAILKRKSEIRIGLNTHTYHLDLDRVAGIDVLSFGLFFDCAIYPLNNGMYAGIRWEALSTTSILEDAKTKLKNEGSYDKANLEVGTGLYFQCGYQYDISNKFSVRLSGLPGVQSFKVSKLPSRLSLENHYQFVFDIMLGFEIKR
ncbi:hypothetical protein AGMMS49965_25670 [Bacteroidia bacterium]|nr:hypothetical protein AGMMS49965_25670 [Bacteroidia bacterium]